MIFEPIIERQGKNVLILRKLDSPRRTWCKGPMCQYELEYRWLANETCDISGINSHVLGSDYTIYPRKEVIEVIKGNKTLFQAFNLF